MRNCFRHFMSSGVASLFIFITMATSCTQVDNNLGSGLIPGDQQMSMRIDTLNLDAASGIKARISFTDSINSFNQTLAIMGKTRSSVFGKTETATLLQYLPALIKTDTTSMGFGHGATVDSVKMLMTMYYMSGDKDVEQTFNIFAMRDSLPTTDTTYFVNIPYRDYIDEQAPVFTFKYKGETTGDKVEQIKVEKTPAGEEFLKELLSDTKVYDTTLVGRNLFREKFHGFVIAPAAESPDNGALYYTVLNSTALDLYFHNYTDASLSTVKDKAVRQSFYFDDTANLYKNTPRNNSVISVEHDYTGTGLDGVKAGPIDAPLTGYIQGVAGVTTTLEFPDSFFETIEALKGDARDIMINQAMLYVYLEDDTTELMDAAHSRLGSYMNYNTLTPIPDYIYTEEAAGTALPYGGSLNRTYGYYAMNITHYLHRALNDESIQREFTLAPLAYPYVPNDALTWKETALTISDATDQSASGKQIRVKLTYTFIK